MKMTPATTEKSDNTKTPPKTSITQLLQNDLGRSVGVTTATQLVRLTGLQVQPSHSLGNIKDIYSDIRIEQAVFRPSASSGRMAEGVPTNIKGTRIRNLSPLRRSVQGPSYSPHRFVSQSATL